MSSTARFTAYLSPRERELLDTRAREEGCSGNYLVRNAVRAILGLEVPARIRGELLKALEDEPCPRCGGNDDHGGHERWCDAA